MPPQHPTDLPIRLFANDAAWERWLAKQHAKSDGLWLRFARKDSSLKSVSYQEALDTALCWGWIDGLKKTYDDESYILRFTPRRAKSVWSQINRDKVTALTKLGRMQPSGIAAVDAAKGDGRWDNAYPSQSTATVPDELQAALDASPKARKFFATLSSVNRYAIIIRVFTARKPETRARRIAEFVAMLEQGETIYP